MLIEIAPGIDIQAITVDQILETIRELIDIGHSAAFDQHRNDVHPVAEGRLDFDANGVGRIINPSPPPSRTEPTLADDDERDVGFGKHGIDVLAKVDSHRDIVDIPKYGIATIMSH